MNKNCKHCHQNFDARRRNHLYCTLSCKTLASYKRNNYRYVSGHYQKDNMLPEIQESSLAVSQLENDSKPKMLEANKQTINFKSVSNAAIGSVAADTVSYGLKKMLAPQSLPATKGDFERLKNDMEELKRLLFQSKNGF
ncbi:hypothetical protein [Gelidibacter mesophilus]|uniref:hypothetical protein n=1 Tax=Gelidibacter mesophilus TaxID=169050 RepID=UPI0012FAAC0E|nr:hypothetical protein [Gelidibacter mesophilus]